MVEVLLMANASDAGVSRGSKSKKQIGNCNVNIAQCNAEVKKANVIIGVGSVITITIVKVRPVMVMNCSSSNDIVASREGTNCN